MKAIYQISAGQLTPFINTFVKIGTPINPLLGAVGLSPSVLENSSKMIPEYAAWHMVDIISQKESIDNLGIFVASVERESCFDELGIEMAKSTNLISALRCLVTQLLKYANYQNYWLSENTRYIFLCRVGTPGIDVGAWQMEQYVLSYFISFIKSYLGASWTPEFICVQAPESIDKQNAFKDISVNYLMPHGAIAIDKRHFSRDIDRSIVHPSSHQQQSGKQTLELLTEMISNRVFEKNASLDNVASALGINRRQLQRTLETEGTSYREIKSKAMIQLACQLLRESSLCIIDISLELGYQNPKNFTRAFKAVTGITPSEYRAM